jgi:carboxymethylenebutenolidase
MRTFSVILVAAIATVAIGCRGDVQPTAREPQGRSDDYVERMAQQHQDDTPQPSTMLGEAPAQPVTTSTVEYASSGGTAAAGFFARPATAPGGPLPGLIVIHEWWGLNDNIRHVTELLASEGFQALAVDLFGGEVATDPESARTLTQTAMEDPGRARDNLEQARRFLAEQGADDVGVIGWCFGGTWALRGALAMPEEIDAVVVYYGHPVTDRAELERLRMPLLGLFGAEDQGIPVRDVREFEAILRGLGANAEIRIYEGAGHAFANPSGNRYDAPIAADAWRRTVAFLKRYLGPGQAQGSL